MIGFFVYQEGLWATQDYSSQQLVTYPCPPQYCQCALGVQGRTTTCKFTFDSLDSDSQCNCDREGEVRKVNVAVVANYMHMHISAVFHLCSQLSSWLHVYVCGQSSYNLRTEPTSVLVVTSLL